MGRKRCLNECGEYMTFTKKWDENTYTPQGLDSNQVTTRVFQSKVHVIKRHHRAGKTQNSMKEKTTLEYGQYMYLRERGRKHT